MATDNVDLPDLANEGGAAAAVPRTDNQALSSSSRTYAFADDSGIREKNDVPKNRRHTVITIIEAMMCEVPHLC